MRSHGLEVDRLVRQVVRERSIPRGVAVNGNGVEDNVSINVDPVGEEERSSHCKGTARDRSRLVGVREMDYVHAVIAIDAERGRRQRGKVYVAVRGVVPLVGCPLQGCHRVGVRFYDDLVVPVGHAGSRLVVDQKDNVGVVGPAARIAGLDPLGCHWYVGISIKEASGSVDEFKLYVADAPKAKVFSGDDALLPVFSKVGAKGLISVSSNSWPAQTHLYTEQCLDGKLSDDDQRLWADCTNTMFIASNPIPVKRLMYEQGTIKTSVLRAPLTHRDLENADRVLTADEKINTWYKNQ